MELRVGDGLVIGDEALCALYGGGFDGRTVHACKDRCHKVSVGYEKSILAQHPEYLVARRGDHLFLNLIDPPVPLFRAESFTAALDFIDEAVRDGKPCAIHCNQGRSRAPSIALLWLAKRAKRIPDSFQEARIAFEKILAEQEPTASYQPGRGIATFLEATWGELR